MKSFSRLSLAIFLASTLLFIGTVEAKQKSSIHQNVRRSVDYNVNVDTPSATPPSADIQVDNSSGRVTVRRPTVHVPSAPSASVGIKTPTPSMPSYKVPTPNIPGVNISTPTIQVPSLPSAGVNVKTPSIP